jgi:hypothetical protein
MRTDEMLTLPNVFHVIGGNHAFVSHAVACEPPQWFDFLDNHEDLSLFEWQIFVVLRSIDDQVGSIVMASLRTLPSNLYFVRTRNFGY